MERLLVKSVAGFRLEVFSWSLKLASQVPLESSASPSSSDREWENNRQRNHGERENEGTTSLRPPPNLQLQAIPSVTHTHHVTALSDVQIARTECLVKLSSSAVTRMMDFSRYLISTIFRQAVFDVGDLSPQPRDVAYITVMVNRDTYHPLELPPGYQGDCDSMLHGVDRRTEPLHDLHGVYWDYLEGINNLEWN